MNQNASKQVFGFWSAATLYRFRFSLSVLALFSFSWRAFAADIPKLPVPKSPYLPIVYRYADTMLEKGRSCRG